MSKESLDTTIENKSAWLLRTRWVVLFSIFIVVIITLAISRLQFFTVPILTLLFISGFYFIVIGVLTKKLPELMNSNPAILIRIFFDFLIASALVHLTGGITSPFLLVFAIEIAIISTVYPLWLSFSAAMLATAMIGSTYFLEASGFITHFAPTPNPLFFDPGYVFAIIAAFFLFSIILADGISHIQLNTKEKQKRIEMLSDEKSDLMNMLAHEIRSPLTSVTEYTALFLDGLVGPVKTEQKKYLEIIMKQSTRIVNMVSDLLDISRIESGRIKLEKSKCNITTIINNAIDEMRPQYDNKKIAISINVSSQVKPIEVDETKILQVFINLLSNALKFSDQNSTVSVSAELNKKKQLIASVCDQGIGIEKESLTKVFDKFFSATQTTSKMRSTGLGLALCKTIIEAHDGTIWAESLGLGKGACFKFTLPT